MPGIWMTPTTPTRTLEEVRLEVRRRYGVDITRAGVKAIADRAEAKIAANIFRLTAGRFMKTQFDEQMEREIRLALWNSTERDEVRLSSRQVEAMLDRIAHLTEQNAKLELLATDDDDQG